MTLRKIVQARRKLRVSGPPSDRLQILRSLIRRCESDVARVDDRTAGVVSDFQTWLEAWTGVEASQHARPHAIANDTRLGRMYRWAAVAALLLEVLVAGWFFSRNGLDWRVGVVSMVLVAIVMHATLYYVAFGSTGWLRPRETYTNLRWFIIPALVLLVPALVLALLPRYLSGPTAANQQLHDLLSIGLLVGSLALLVLAASCFCAAFVWSTSEWFERQYQGLVDERARTADFLEELQLQSLSMASSTAPIKASSAASAAVATTSPILPMLLVAAAALSVTACSPSASAVSVDNVPVFQSCVESGSTADIAPIVVDSHTQSSCEVEVDISGSVVGLNDGWGTIASALPAIALREQCGTLKVSTFDTDGWLPRKILECRLPVLEQPAPVTVRGEWAEGTNVKEGARMIAEAQLAEAQQKYEIQLRQAMSGLRELTLLPSPDHHSERSDIAGMLRRHGQSDGSRRRVVIVLSDFADTRHLTLPPIPPPTGNLSIVGVVAPTKEHEAKLYGESAESSAQYTGRVGWLRKGAPWVTPVPIFTTNLPEVVADLRSATPTH